LADFYTTRPGRHSVICQRSPIHCTPCQPTLANGLEAESYPIPRIWRTGFYIDGCATVWTVAVRRVIFKGIVSWKFAILSLVSLES
jgi:hypothetical protein